MSRTSTVRSSFLLLMAAGCVETASAPVPSPPKPPVSTQSLPEQTMSETSSVVEPDPETDPNQPLNFRPDDVRPQHDEAELAAAGILRYESRRLKLYTDIDPALADTLPPVADRLYEALVEYFGPLPPDRQGGDFQITAYIMRDEAAFHEQGLLEEITTLHHGLHRQNRCWMRDQQFDYYRRHLLLHECTHCFMTFLPGPRPPVWYMEGMAELFGTHRLHRDGRVEFRIMPLDGDDVGGWGRIEAVRKDCAAHRALTIRGVYELPNKKFFQPEAYAWSWALCHFLDAHPRTSDRFRTLGRHRHDGLFDQKFHEAFLPEQRNLSTEWTLFASQLQAGYDTVRAAIDFIDERRLAPQQVRQTVIRADRGWQDVGVRVDAGQMLELTARGQFILADDPQPWVSEPQGISIHYFQGLPLGRLMACLDPDPVDDTAETDTAQLLHIVPIGKSARWTIPAHGRLLLRLNDAWDSLDENSGSVEVTIRRVDQLGADQPD